jgi:hypothetical protein
LEEAEEEVSSGDVLAGLLGKGEADAICCSVSKAGERRLRETALRRRRVGLSSLRTQGSSVVDSFEIVSALINNNYKRRYDAAGRRHQLPRCFCRLAGFWGSSLGVCFAHGP